MTDKRKPRGSASGLSPTVDEIRSAREDAGLSQTAAAAMIYCTLRGWQDWEGGKRRMHPAMWELFRLKLPLVKEKKKA